MIRRIGIAVMILIITVVTTTTASAQTVTLRKRLFTWQYSFDGIKYKQVSRHLNDLIQTMGTCDSCVSDLRSFRRHKRVAFWTRIISLGALSSGALPNPSPPPCGRSDNSWNNWRWGFLISGVSLLTFSIYEDHLAADHLKRAVAAYNRRGTVGIGLIISPRVRGTKVGGMALQYSF